MPNPPALGTTTDGKWEDDFRARQPNDPRQEASKAMVMDYGIKSPSLSKNREPGPSRDPGPNASKKLTPLHCDVSGKRFR